MTTLQKKSNNVCFEYGKYMIVSSSVEEVENWINTLPGLTCSEHAKKNLDCIINNEWVVWGYYNQNKSPLNKDGYRLNCLKTTGISTGQIDFFITECKNVEEIIAKREAFKLKVEGLKEKVSDIRNTLGKELLEKLSSKSKSCVELYQHGNGTRFILRIGQRGYWYNDGFSQGYSYIDEYFSHFDGETLITDEGKNVIDVLKQFLHEN